MNYRILDLITMAVRSVSQQHFFLYLICISIVAAFDTYNSFVRLKPDKKKNTQSDKSNKKSSQNKDKGTLTLIYLAKFLPNIMAILIYYFFQNTRYSSLLPSSSSATLGIATFIAGLLIRQIAIIQLGKFYTYKVSISDDHEMIDTGLYAFMRHPAYTGTFLELTGAALLYNHLIFSWFLSLPYLIVVLKRIKQEEKVLIEEFGPKYQEYMKRAGMFLPKLN
jgi:protein-S-isoprenylcysteine O-methyltransferase Ste14